MQKKHITGKNIALFLLRIALGWLFFYAGLEKLLNPNWDATGFLTHAKTFQSFYGWFGSAANISWVNFLVPWGETLIGLGLIFGTLTRLASYFGILLLALFYFPSLEFPYVENGILVDDHFIYILVFAVFIHERAGAFWGLDSFINKKIKSWWV
ncbi:DoxX family protein [Candidatus Peregrinibacteria bacterium]|nr:DoxX family protein [Candidatus Peregrinibacteria bacterium]